jgi:NitT/TauT family transport system substrate-binding protein
VDRPDPKPAGRRRAPTLAAALVALALLGAACGGSGDGDDASSGAGTTVASTPTTGGTPSSGPGTPEPQPLAERTSITASIVVDGVEAYSQLLLAEAMGEFDKENLDVTITKVPTSESVALLGQDKLDLAPLGANIALLNAIDQGVDVAIVGTMPDFPDTTRSGFWMRSELVPADGEVDPCSLEGLKTVLGGTAGFGSTAVRPYAEFIAGCPDFAITDIQLSTLTGPELLIALENGAVDVAYLPDPLWADPEEKGYAELIIPYSGATGNGWVMGPLREDRPEVADAIARAMVRTTRTYLQGDYRQDPEVRAALIEALGVPEDLFDDGVSLVFPPDMRFDTSVAEVLQAIWLEVGGLLAFDEPLPVDRVVDDQVLDRVLGG